MSEQATKKTEYGVEVGEFGGKAVSINSDASSCCAMSLAFFVCLSVQVVTASNISATCHNQDSKMGIRIMLQRGSFHVSLHIIQISFLLMLSSPPPTCVRYEYLLARSFDSESFSQLGSQLSFSFHQAYLSAAVL